MEFWNNKTSTQCDGFGSKIAQTTSKVKLCFLCFLFSTNKSRLVAVLWFMWIDGKFQESKTFFSSDWMGSWISHRYIFLSTRILLLCFSGVDNGAANEKKSSQFLQHVYLYSRKWVHLCFCSCCDKLRLECKSFDSKESKQKKHSKSFMDLKNLNNRNIIVWLHVIILLCRLMLPKNLDYFYLIMFQGLLHHFFL